MVRHCYACPHCDAASARLYSGFVGEPKRVHCRECGRWWDMPEYATLLALIED